MRIDGAWRLCDDGFVRPVISAELLAADGSWVQAPLLADTAADRTVLSADIGRQLNLTAQAVSAAVYRLRQRYRQLVRNQVADTVTTSNEIDAELAHLFE